MNCWEHPNKGSVRHIIVMYFFLFSKHTVIQFNWKRFFYYFIFSYFIIIDRPFFLEKKFRRNREHRCKNWTYSCMFHQIKRTKCELFLFFVGSKCTVCTVHTAQSIRILNDWHLINFFFSIELDHFDEQLEFNGWFTNRYQKRLIARKSWFKLMNFIWNQK